MCGLAATNGNPAVDKTGLPICATKINVSFGKINYPKW